MNHSAAAAIAVMILDPASAEKRTAAIEALVVAPDEEYEAAINAFVFTYPKAEPLRVLIAALRVSNKRKRGSEPADTSGEWRHDQ
jgi:hypothetical protein